MAGEDPGTGAGWDPALLEVLSGQVGSLGDSDKLGYNH